MTQDEAFMKRALQLAGKGRGTTSPNPMVGAVIVKNGTVVGEGWHERAGEPHAEVHALRTAGDAAHGATLYVTLEPCSHWGRTGPCAEAVIRAGVSRVVMAVRDPNPKVAGRGAALLRNAGVQVEEGVLAEEATRLNEIFFHWIVNKRPFCLAKYAMSMDGKIATATGESKWISSEASRRQVQQLRHALDSILVGVDTVIADNPALTCRLPDGRQPLRVILDSHGRIPANAHVVTMADAKTLIATTADGEKKLQTAFAKKAHVSVCVLPADDNGRVSLPDLLSMLGERMVTSMLVEGGAGVLGSFFAAELIDKLQIYLAPLIIGGKTSPGPVGGAGTAQLALAPRFVIDDYQAVGDDLLITAYPKKAEGDGRTCLQA